MANVQLNDATKLFDGGIRGIEGVTLAVPSGACLAILGPSGCGKTTLLRLVAGLEEPTRGSVTVGGREVSRVKPQDRDVAMAFQTPALYPQLTVRANLGFAMTVRKTAATEVERRVAEVAGALGLAELLDRMPHQLSGGQRQRVALGRVLVRRPAVLLLDEPLSHLDVPLRAGVRATVVEQGKRFGMTTLWVTHDPAEAAAVGDAVAEMAGGTILASRERKRPEL